MNNQRWWSIFKMPETAASVREKRELLQEQVKLDRVKKNRKLSENYSPDYWLNNYSDILNRYQDQSLGNYPISQPTDRQYGSNFPFWVSESQLSIIRAAARYIVTTSPNAQGLLNGLTSYVIGSGFSYRIAPIRQKGSTDELITEVQKFIDAFIEANAWGELEQELFYRSREDGEAFLRLFPQLDGTMVVRTVEPEQIYQPGGTQLQEWSYGIQTEEDDVNTILAYHVDYRAAKGAGEGDKMQGECVPAEQMIHIKSNVKRSIKRGLSDFSFDTLESFTQAGKLRRNIGEGAAVQAAIAAVRQHDTASSDQVTDFISTNIDYSTTSSSGREQHFEKLEPGSFLDIPKGMIYVPPPAAANSAAHLEVFAGLLRTAGNRHNAPEWLASSDASNGNYASSLTAEAPFTRHCLRLQEFYKGHFKKVIIAVINHAIDCGKFDTNLWDMIELQVKAPSVETRDKSAEANANQIYSTLGIKSKQTIAQEIGLDWTSEELNIDEHPTSATPMQMPDGDPAQVEQSPAEELAGQPAADTALNGAQIQSLVNVVTQCVQGLLPISAGIAIAQSSFPLISPKVIQEIFADIVVNKAPDIKA